MRGATPENIAILAVFTSIIVAGAVYIAWYVARFLDDQRWLRTQRKMRAKGNVVSIQPRVNRHANRRPPESR